MKTAIFVYDTTEFDSTQPLKILVFKNGTLAETIDRGPSRFALDPGFYGVLTADPPAGTRIIAPLYPAGGTSPTTASIVATADKDDWPDPPPKANIEVATLYACLPKGKGEETDLPPEAE